LTSNETIVLIGFTKLNQQGVEITKQVVEWEIRGVNFLFNIQFILRLEL